MNLRTMRIILIISAVAAFLFAGFIAWILGTPRGAGRIITAVSDMTSLEISAAEIEGRLWDGLKLNGLKITWKEGYLSADGFYLRWQPLHLLIGNVAVNEVFLKNLFIQDNSEEKETDLRWPEITGIPSRVDGWIDSLKIERLSVRRRDQNALVLREVASAVVWHDSRLTLRDFSIASVGAQTAGTVAAGFRRPFLYADVGVRPSTPLHGMTAFIIKMNLTAAAEPFELKGRVSIAGSGSSRDKIKLGGEVGLKRYAVVIQKMILSESGRRGRVTGEGEIDFRPEEPELNASLQLRDLDLSPELKAATHLQGQISVRGNIGNYEGTLKLSNSGETWRAAELSGSFRGGKTGIQFILQQGSWMRGNLHGEMKGTWAEGVSVSAELSGRNIDPAAAAGDWRGAINFDISGKMNFPKERPASGELSGLLLKSTLHGRSLTGQMEMNLIGENLIIKKLFLQGKGFEISAKGELRRRLTFFANIIDLSGLLPETKGSLRAEGWIAVGEYLRVSGTVRGKHFAAGDLTVKVIDLDARFFEDEKAPVHLTGNVRGIRYGNVTVRTAQAQISGSEEQHILRLSMDSNLWSVYARVSAAYHERSWSGKIIELNGRDAVGSFKTEKTASISASAQGISIDGFSLLGEGSERLRMNLNVSGDLTSGVIHLDWTGLNLARAGQLMKRTTLHGKTSGRLNASWTGRNLSTLTGEVEASGLLGINAQRIDFEKTSLNVYRNENDITADFDLLMKKHGTVKGRIVAAQPVSLGLPDRADIDIRLTGMDAMVLKPWLPEEIDMKGSLSAEIQGKLLPDKRTDVSGSVKLSETIVLHVTQKGELSGHLRSAQISFVWRGDKLSGDVGLTLTDYGSLKGNFSLPVPARLPFSPAKDKPLLVSIEGIAKEQGILTSLFPGLVQESQGKLKLDLTISGSWNEPVYSGEAVLSDGGAYLPPAGIRLKDVSAAVRFDRNRIVIERFSARSGKGGIEGNAEVRIEQFGITEYKGKLTGEDFQAIYLPDLQAAINPNLTFEGRKNNASLRGEVKVTELFVYESEREVIEPSKDVVIVDAPKEKEKETPLRLDINVRVILGDKVFVKMEGIDARLKGAVDLKAKSLEDISGTGTIEVVKGKYKRYGIDLDIKRGKVVFAGGPADNPSLDFLALREIDDVKAGVLATGTLRSPRVNLYSEPPMPDTDILSYIVLGHPPGAAGEQIALLSRAAGMLLSGGESATLQAKLQQRLGIDVLDIESGGSEIERSAVTIGKYLTPQLYVGYGVSLFTGQNIMRLKYKLSKRLELQTESGLETGIDLFYKVQFK